MNGDGNGNGSTGSTGNADGKEGPATGSRGADDRARTPSPARDRTRRYVLGGVVAALGILTGGILLEVLGTILFALTVAYVLMPVQRWLTRRRLSEWTATIVATLIGFVSAVAVFSPIFVTLYFRLEEVIAVVEDLPREFSVTVLEETYTLEAAQVQAEAIGYLQGVAVSIASSLPVLAIKFALFVLLLFAILLKGDAAGRAAIAPVPHAYRDVVYALARRARETLYAIYVLQLATSVATLVISYPLFWALGYDMAFTLALFAAILQFVPIIGPSLLIVPIALYHVAAGEIVAAALVGVLGIAFVGWFPDVAVRPRLARRSAGLPGSLYFVGFTGGLFTLGAIGIVVGPLIVAVFVESVDLLADEVNGDVRFAELAAVDAANASSEAPSSPDRDSTPESDAAAEAEEDADAAVGSQVANH
ncbi:Predicted PurR-regulated permease PerM [Halobiforma haloterrestris]|uniref:Predicted PurR-regulated permease PerM n=1 Tax=Natronobacterium haloterrestre TaxID=148448 RepID=A0A1I1HEX7_NATHA|nr:AI-2E family transporter [Halobiforma haloterrestris]SFC20538.1 Predicted PurR-regulated permease PerM [Halobiforma haloterrestris]